MNHDRLYRQFTKLAIRQRYDETLKHRHHSAVVQYGEIISIASNVRTETTLHGNRTKCGWHSSIHSEVRAYTRARKSGLLVLSSPFHVYNVRFNRSGVITPSPPCQQCHSYISKLGGQFYTPV